MVDRNYIGEFASWDDVRSNYGDDCPTEEPRFVFAQYETPAYEGYSTVITSTGADDFFIVEGSHCSCFGLEGQWEPTRHDSADLRKMMEASYGFFHDHKDRLTEWIKETIWV
jgi:hypothetical protein